MQTSSPSLLSYIRNLCGYVWSLRDPRIKKWSIHSDARFVFPVLIGYVYIAKVAGPRWMKNREAFNLRGAILAYNLATAVASAYFCVQYVRHSYLQGGYSLFCQGIDYEKSFDEHTAAIVNLNWWYSWVRIADFLDTFFFLARKKNSKVTNLHVIHHFLVVLNAWIYTNFGSDGQTLLGLCVNPFVHVIMYSYYFLAALGPTVQKYLWWKRHLTQLQIVQFVGLMMHMAITLFYDCGYPRALALLAISQGFLGLGLFVNFYVKTYREAAKRKEKEL
ncbi:very long chain fatty acid elongase AAEL008004-like [Dermacentor albipictus]|uniref:very long chain fatty acid elongase AAEL008004-like n=1 Tax=Dermacentor albipictus TaxID=60249 RepID=UPI0031FE2709